MKTEYKTIGVLYEYTALCSGCGKKANKKSILCNITDVPHNPFKDNSEAMPVGWYSQHNHIYCPKCKGE